MFLVPTIFWSPVNLTTSELIAVTVGYFKFVPSATRLFCLLVYLLYLISVSSKVYKSCRQIYKCLLPSRVTYSLAVLPIKVLKSGCVVDKITSIRSTL
jgi:hypothetical protein